ncbi:MAG TPA: hypothetical protein VHU92_08025 [Streptosporangiaceae bacterium]|jgi:hypothetical protein|nr:hypothetical protein [Streptosporangiaceae bacterium]
MSGPDDLTAATPVPASQGPISRRSVLRTAAGAGLAAGTLAATGVPALAATTRTAAHPAPRHGAGADPHAETGTDEPIVVHLRNARTGEIDIFRGTSQTRVHDHALAAQLIRASR